MKTLLTALAAALCIAQPAAASVPDPIDRNPATWTMDMAVKLGICVLDECAVRYEADGVTVAKLVDFSDWQDCYIWRSYERSFIVELAGCAP